MIKNLIVKEKNTIIFTSDGHWLYPLFELENFLNSSTYSIDDISLDDKLIGRGAAVLITAMGIKRCHGRILSRKALTVLDHYKIHYTYDELVDSLQCQTETALTDDMSLDESYEELARRAGRKKDIS
jgi:Domain of unknown function (DUF1893)